MPNFVKYNKNSTREQALLDKDGGRIFFPTDATSIIVDGKEYGVGGESWAENVIYNDDISQLNVDNVQDAIDSTVSILRNDETVIASSLNDLYTTLYNKQDELVSGKNIKTINGESVLGYGDIVVRGGGSSYAYEINYDNTVLSLLEATNIQTAIDETVHIIIDNEYTTAQALTHLNDELSGKQNLLVSGDNVKTLHNQSILGSGDITLNTSDLNNDSGFVDSHTDELENYYSTDETYNKEEVNDLIDVIKQFDVVVADSLPVASELTQRKMYLTPSEDSAVGNAKEEHITLFDGTSYYWELIGSTAIDLTGYATEEYVDEVVSVKADDANVVHITGDENIAGSKIFTNGIRVSDNGIYVSGGGLNVAGGGAIVNGSITANSVTVNTTDFSGIKNVTTANLQSALDAKQNTISDLSTIRTNASNGATAYSNLNGHTVLSNVPANAKFTDTIYDDTAVSNRVTSIENQEASWNAKYNKPSTGIPYADLASSVQSSLNKADSALQSHQSIKTINNTTMVGTGNVSVVSSIYMDGVTKTPVTSGTNVGRVDIGNVATSIYMNNTNYTPTTGSTNTGRVNLGSVVTNIRVNGTDQTITSGRVNLGNVYSKEEVDSQISSAVSAEANTRQTEDNKKQDKLNTAPGYSSTNNVVLVAVGGTIQWKQFNNILAGSTTPISSEGVDGDLYIQTQ